MEIRIVLRIGVLLVALAAVFGCRRAPAAFLPPPPLIVEPAPAGEGPPPWAPAHGRRARYRYRYYPDVQVYFDVDRRIYFFLDAGAWRAAPAPPPGLHFDLSGYVELGMDTDLPYRFHGDVRAAYPPGHWKKAHGHELKEKSKGKGHGHGHGRGHWK
ncbi:hypothetical protein G3N55_01995 [Dissulfurirhabdus thermomarina]|uniref:Lipoprotein n=1 Tax=Dissulfurirhabdus thermomarina TaxID=1765737 RepID=A0A6N9TPF9_DISTH|nr:hypothetical protein [Dissulfurirhabdus thermomarina]NDY41624.1 hypothetical protein [Dissulfurirhabdus thermomarina]NMX23333.1 hypothetical protein [Dissulfurirhabdus thermomarina]